MNTPPRDALLDLDRLSDIAALDVFSPELQARLDEHARRTAEVLGTPISLVTVVLDTAQCFAGAHGIEGWLAETRGTPSEWAFCTQAVRSRSNYVVEDASLDPVQHDNPLVTRDGIRSYAGIPLVTSRGQVIGTLCVIGTEPRRFSADDIAMLERLAAEATREIEATREV